MPIEKKKPRRSMPDENISSTSVTITPVPTGQLPVSSACLSTTGSTDSPVTITPVFTAVSIPSGLGSTSTINSNYSSPLTTSTSRSVFESGASATITPSSGGLITSGKSNSDGQSDGVNNVKNNDSSKDGNIVVLNKQRLQELVNEIDPREQLDEEVEDLLLNIADDFIDNVVTNACKLAKHRGAKTLEVKDVQLILEKEWNLFIPGFGPLALTNEFKQLYKKSPATEAHKQRLALIKKTLKKF